MLPALAILSLCGFPVSYLISNDNHFDLYSGVLVVIITNKKGVKVELYSLDYASQLTLSRIRIIPPA